MICLKLLARAPCSLCYQLGLGHQQKRVGPKFSPVAPQKRMAGREKIGIEIRENEMENQNGLRALFYL